MNSKHRNKRLSVVVLAGGDSPEREVSLRSGGAVAQALVAAGHEVTAIDPAGRELGEVDWSRFDGCFLALHGGAGEDGRVQQQLELLGVAYTGSGPDACRLAMSKSASKQRFVECGVPTLPWATIDAHDVLVDAWECVAPLRYPLVLKPDAQGSSLGVVVVDEPEALGDAVATAGAYDGLVLAEPQVHGREFTVAVLGERTLPILEIVSPDRVFSYDAKYASAATEYRFDFELATATRVQMLQAASGATRRSIRAGWCGSI